MVRRTVAVTSIVAVVVAAGWLVTASGTDGEHGGDPITGFEPLSIRSGPFAGLANRDGGIDCDDPEVANREICDVPEVEDLPESEPVEPAVAGCAVDNFSEIRNAPRTGNRKRVALTFDDGPGPFTQQVLDILDEHNAVGTFFVLGIQSGGDRKMLRRIVRQGSELANHSYGHERDADIKSMRDTNGIIRKATGFTPCLYRPPYGVVSPAGLDAAERLGMATILWDVDTGDWSDPGVETIVNRAVEARKGSIVLMHDAGRDRDQTVAALPDIIRTLKKKNFKFVTVSELLGFEPLTEPERKARVAAANEARQAAREEARRKAEQQRRAKQREKAAAEKKAAEKKARQQEKKRKQGEKKQDKKKSGSSGGGNGGASGNGDS